MYLHTPSFHPPTRAGGFNKGAASPANKIEKKGFVPSSSPTLQDARNLYRVLSCHRTLSKYHLGPDVQGLTMITNHVQRYVYAAIPYVGTQFLQ